MISFACKKITRKELFTCSFDLNKTEYELLDLLLGWERGKTTIDLARKLGLERTTVQKSLSKLLEKELVTREKETLPKGGYVYVYKSKDEEEILGKVEDLITEWYKTVIQSIRVR